VWRFRAATATSCDLLFASAQPGSPSWTTGSFGSGGRREFGLNGAHPFQMLEMPVDVKEVRKLDAYLKRLFGNQKIRVVPRPKKDDSAEVYIGEEFIGVLFVDDEDDDRSFQLQVAILESDLEDAAD
jgi:hypothetical protein